MNWRHLFMPALVGCLLTFGTRDGHAQNADPSWSSFSEIALGAVWLQSPEFDRARPGFGATVAQGVRFRRLVFSVGVGLSYFLGKEDPPPFAGSTRILDVKPSVGYLAPVGPLSVSAETFYALRHFRGNGIVQVTGDAPTHHGVGLASTIRYPATRVTYLALRPYYQLTPTTDERLHDIGLLFVIGFSATID